VAKQLRIRQVKSGINSQRGQRETLIGKVRHLVVVEEMDGSDE
jgi:ribosomal protein L30/L7E